MASVRLLFDVFISTLTLVNVNSLFLEDVEGMTITLRLWSSASKLVSIVLFFVCSVDAFAAGEAKKTYKIIAWYALWHSDESTVGSHLSIKTRGCLDTEILII